MSTPPNVAPYCHMQELHNPGNMFAYYTPNIHMAFIGKQVFTLLYYNSLSSTGSLFLYGDKNTSDTLIEHSWSFNPITGTRDTCRPGT